MYHRESNAVNWVQLIYQLNINNLQPPRLTYGFVNAIDIPILTVWHCWPKVAASVYIIRHEKQQCHKQLFTIIVNSQTAFSGQ